MGEYSWFEVSASVFALLVLAPFLALIALMLIASAPVLLSMLLPVAVISAGSGR
jgi:hypothetical protein